MAPRSELAARWTFDKVSTPGLSVVMAVYSFWLASNRTWKPDYAQLPDSFSGTFFRDQAVAMLHGRLWVPERAFANECFTVGGKCFGYFGIFPSLVRLPMFAILRTTEYSLAPVSIAIAAGIGTWAILDLLRHALGSPSAGRISRTERILIMIIGYLILAAGGSFVTLSQAKVYREASTWMVALTLLTFAFTLRWTKSGANRHLAITLLAAVCATNSRPSVVPVMVALGVWIYLRQYAQSRIIHIKFDSIAFAILSLPAITASAVMYLKFRQLTPPLKAWADYLGPGPTLVRQMNGGKMQGLRFVPTNLVQYLRPDSIRYAMSQPWATSLVPDEKAAILVPPIITNGILTEPTVSITNAMPLQLILTIFTSSVALWRTRISQFIDRVEVLPLLLVSALGAPLALTMYSTTTRYVADFFPMLVVGAIFGGVGICAWLNEKNRLRPALYGLLPCAIYLALVHYSLNVNGWNSVG